LSVFDFFAIFVSFCSKLLVCFEVDCVARAIVEEDCPRKGRKDTEMECRPAPTRLGGPPSRTARSTCPHSFRAFRSFRGQIVFLPVRLLTQSREAAKWNAKILSRSKTMNECLEAGARGRELPSAATAQDQANGSSDYTEKGILRNSTLDRSVA
jgi:hypothetical protein